MPLIARRAAAAILLVAAAPLALALSYRIESAVPATATLHATRVDGVAEPLHREIRVPSSGTLDVAAGTWELRLESDLVWAQRVWVKAADDVAIPARPAGSLRAKIAGEDALPASAAAFLTPSDVNIAGGNDRIDVECPIHERQLTCTVPAGTWDVRIAPPAFVPQFRWSVRIAAGEATRVDDVRLIAGASVTGTVAHARGAKLPEGTRVQLVPSTLGATAARPLSIQATPNAKGFFQFVAVPPGEYFVTASAPSLISESRPVVVVANRSADIRAPLLLDTPKRLRATILPMLDPDGKPWIVSLSQRRQGTVTVADALTSAPADEKGVWERSGLRAGTYDLSIERRDGSRWASVPVAIANDDVDVPIGLAASVVEGTVRYGDQPIAARLHFGGEFGAIKQILVSGDDGTFRGMLPPGNDTWDVFVETETPPTRRTLKGVRGRSVADGERVAYDIELPRTAVTGVVVKRDGTPVADAIVNVDGTAAGGAFDQLFADKEGAFQITGLASGTYRVSADGYLLSSDIVSFDVAEDVDTPPLRLVVNDVQQVRGRVIARNGTPVIGALISAVPRDVPVMLGADARTTESGAFALVVPPAAKLLDVLIASPGFTTVIGRVGVRTDKMMEVTVDQQGGRLLADVAADAPAVLRHAGAMFPMLVLTREGGGSVDTAEARQRFTIPSLEPGEYTLCVKEQCTSGLLAPHGTLTLRL